MLADNRDYSPINAAAALSFFLIAYADASNTASIAFRALLLLSPPTPTPAPPAGGGTTSNNHYNAPV
ncbi:hypothetical protein C8A01DRAFT_42022 [Parachaetomium inaequale]|uniref:Uncharacterized protein n=1 Tax=Parachaetomium inaequale TaxID=2588326 RepID=A0AAN6SLI7_9PEZI|nr:hypothetical protein C8A01DRAFT_42022 [Parachaetomium inaequale]